MVNTSSYIIEGMTFVANLKMGGAIALVEQFSPWRVAELTIRRRSEV